MSISNKINSSILKSKSPIKKITGIQLTGEFPDVCYRLIMPDYGMPIIGTVLEDAGYDVTIYMEHVHPVEWETIAQSDLVCMSVMSAGAAKSYKLADRIRSELGIPVIMGGTHPTFYMKTTLNHCDYVVVGEGDETILELVETLSNGGDISQVAGIIYKQNNQIIRTANRPSPRQFNTIQNYKLIKGYRKLSLFETLTKLRLNLITAQSSRGCPFDCTFCIVETMFGNYRTREVENLIEDIRDKRQYGNELIFVDNYFGVNVPFTTKFLNRLIEEDLNYDILTLTRIEIAQKDELLKLMRKAGVSTLFLGIESVHPDTLITFDKKQTAEKINQAVEKFHSFGFRITGSFVFGADCDTLDTLNLTKQFVIDSKLDIAYFFPMWGHFPHKKLGGKTIIPWWRGIFRGWGYCDGNFVTHFPKQMRPSELQTSLINGHDEIFSVSMAAKAILKGEWMLAREKAQHKFMWSFIKPGLKKHVKWLKEIEGDFYTKEGLLLEDKLKAHVDKDKSWIFPESLGNEQTDQIDSDNFPSADDLMADASKIICNPLDV